MLLQKGFLCIIIASVVGVSPGNSKPFGVTLHGSVGLGVDPFQYSSPSSHIGYRYSRSPFTPVNRPTRATTGILSDIRNIRSIYPSETPSRSDYLKNKHHVGARVRNTRHASHQGKAGTEALLTDLMVDRAKLIALLREKRKEATTATLNQFIDLLLSNASRVVRGGRRPSAPPHDDFSTIAGLDSRLMAAITQLTNSRLHTAMYDRFRRLSPFGPRPIPPGALNGVSPGPMPPPPPPASPVGGLPPPQQPPASPVGGLPPPLPASPIGGLPPLPSPLDMVAGLFRRSPPPSAAHPIMARPPLPPNGPYPPPANRVPDDYDGEPPPEHQPPPPNAFPPGMTPTLGPPPPHESLTNPHKLRLQIVEPAGLMTTETPLIISGNDAPHTENIYDSPRAGDFDHPPVNYPTEQNGIVGPSFEKNDNGFYNTPKNRIFDNSIQHPGGPMEPPFPENPRNPEAGGQIFFEDDKIADQVPHYPDYQQDNFVEPPSGNMIVIDHMHDGKTGKIMYSKVRGMSFVGPDSNPNQSARFNLNQNIPNQYVPPEFGSNFHNHNPYAANTKLDNPPPGSSHYAVQIGGGVGGQNSQFNAPGERDYLTSPEVVPHSHSTDEHQFPGKYNSHNLEGPPDPIRFFEETAPTSHKQPESVQDEPSYSYRHVANSFNSIPEKLENNNEIDPSGEPLYTPSPDKFIGKMPKRNPEEAGRNPFDIEAGGRFHRSQDSTHAKTPIFFGNGEMNPSRFRPEDSSTDDKAAYSHRKDFLKKAQKKFKVMQVSSTDRRERNFRQLPNRQNLSMRKNNHDLEDFSNSPNMFTKETEELSDVLGNDNSRNFPAANKKVGNSTEGSGSNDDEKHHYHENTSKEQQIKELKGRIKKKLDQLSAQIEMEHDENDGDLAKRSLVISGDIGKKNVTFLVVEDKIVKLPEFQKLNLKN